MRGNNIILNNRMEVIRWENNVIPVIIYCHSRKINQYVYSHWHKELEISYLFEGEVEFYNGGCCRVIKDRGVSISNSEEMHYAIPRKETHNEENEIVGITIHIDDSFLRGLISDLDDIYFVIESREMEEELAEKLEYIYSLYCQDEKLETKIKILAAVCELIAVLYEKCKKNRDIVPINEQRDRERTKIIIEYLNEHYREKLLQQELAKKFHFSREYFSRFFKVQTGMTFKEYITQYRLEKAKEDLLLTDKKNLDIALQNGFTSETQFISSFKSAYGETPLKYKKRNKLEKKM